MLSSFISSLGNEGSNMKNVITIIMADRCWPACPMSQLTLCLYIILIVFLFNFSIIPIWAIDQIVIVLWVTHLVPGPLLSTSRALCKPHNSPMASFIVLSLWLRKLRHWGVKVKIKSLVKVTELINNETRLWAHAAISLSVAQSWISINITISKIQTKEKVPWNLLLGENNNNTIITTGTLNCFVVVELGYDE